MARSDTHSVKTCKAFMTPLARTTERVFRQGNPELPSVPTPLLTLEEFFDGNDYTGSIGCNLEAEPEPGEFYEVLKAIRSRAEVSDVRLQITCVDHPGEDWPFSDTIWIMTSAAPEIVRTWLPEHLAPDEVWEGWLDGEYEACSIAEGHRPVAA
jgi:hypothetical protein